MAQQQSTSSKLISRLKEISRGSASPLGFGRVQARDLPAMLLVASLDRNDADLAQAAVAAGADALQLHLYGRSADSARKEASPEGKETKSEAPPAEAGVSAAAAERGGEDASGEAREDEGRVGGLAEERSNIEAVLTVADGRPVGVAVGSGGEITLDELSELARLGVDFVVVHPHRAPAGLLDIEALGHLARLDRDYSSGPLRGLNELGIDAMEVTIGRPDGSLPGLTIHDLANVRQVIEPIRRPVLLLITSTAIQPADLKHFRELGVEALVLTRGVLGTTAEETGAKIREFRQAIDKLGPPIGRGRGAEGRRVILPRVKVPSEAEEEDDEDDED